MIRKCNNPEPLCGGNNCTGSNLHLLDVKCNNVCCPGKISLVFVLCILLELLNQKHLLCKNAAKELENGWVKDAKLKWVANASGVFLLMEIKY